MDVFLSSLLASVVLAAIPLCLAGLGELITEKSGVLNLGVEGMMLLGAVVAFMTAFETHSLWLGLLLGTLVGALAAAMFAFLVVRLLTNQVATGLALTILGAGLSALLGVKYVGQPLTGFEPVAIPVLADVPMFGALFTQTLPAYLSIALVLTLGILLYRSKLGLLVRAVGESPSVAHSIGYNVVAVRCGATMVGGALAGLAGAFIVLVQFKAWQENITSGVGWIAVALVVFATWRPQRLFMGALLFGLMRSLGFATQAASQQIQDWLATQTGGVKSVVLLLTNTQLLNALPYVATIVVLCWISRDWRKIKLNAPASLSQPFLP
ncbi:MAG: ABC transporter permease [Formosimonas sp.]